jgi:glycosyltransferase involved in cell wall biosynthesis
MHQLVHTLSYGDAISGEVLALQRCLQELGLQSEIFAIHTHPKYKGRTRSYLELSPQFSGSVILHYSLGSPLNSLYRSLTQARRILIHHNLTPASWFASINPRIFRDIEQGRHEFPELLGLTDVRLADSRFNVAEIEALGYSAEILELPIDSDKWSVAENPGIMQLLKGDPKLHLLHVGRLAPNKCIEDIIKVFYYLHKFIEPQSKLWLVGIDIDTEVYSFALKRLVHELGLDEAVTFTGQRDDGELKAFYCAASAYICMSEHEGFCLPVIEAMHFGLPVVAFASSALPDTVGTGGILVSEKKHPEIAEIIAKISRPGTLRESLMSAGKQRVAELSLSKFKKRVSELFGAGHNSVLSAHNG